MDSPTVLIADDHHIIHLGLSALIKKIKPIATIHFSIDFPSVIELVKEHAFDLIIMDIDMPGGNFQSTLERAKQIQPRVKVIAFSSADETLFAPRFITRGADGFLDKLSPESQLQSAIESMLDSGSYLSPKVKEIFIKTALKASKHHQNPIDVLTNREIEIATLLIRGDSLKKINEKLFIHVSTISTHKTRIFKKLSVTSNTELANIFKLYNLGENN
jgi:DNA-binding NarL/FixJ family response regulator